MPASRHRGQHGDSCYPCRLSQVQLSPKATPTRSNVGRVLPRDAWNNQWERGIATESRPGGGRIPIINAKAHEIPIKHFVEHRRRFEEGRQQMRRGVAAEIGSED